MAIKVFYSDYKLDFTEGASADGCLLKIEDENGDIGYSDLHPLTQFKDLSKEKQIELYQMKKPTQLFQNSLNFAEKDLVLRKRKQNVFSGSPIKNHFLITHLEHWKTEDLRNLYNYGFKTIKCKWLPSYKITVLKNLINIGFTVRLDFNAKWSYDQVVTFISQLSKSELSRIEFIEDPCAYDFLSWKTIHQRVPLAVDFEGANVNWNGQLPFSFFILKPARDLISDALDKVKKHNLNLVVTSSLDHPVGIMHAAGLLLELQNQIKTCSQTHGLSTFLNLKDREFNPLIKTQGNSLLGTEGTGIGFDQLLLNRRWIRIN